MSAWPHKKERGEGVPFSEEPSPPEIAGLFLVRRMPRENEEAEAIAQDTAKALAEALESVIAVADGMAFTLYDGRDATSLRANRLSVYMRPVMTTTPPSASTGARFLDRQRRRSSSYFAETTHSPPAS